MGILRTREEYLPVTCAILKAEDREAFFGAIKQQKNGRPDNIARLCEVPVDTANDWISGKANVPYHTLQNLAHHYQVTIPPVGELRREYLQVHQTATRRETPMPPPRRASSAEPKEGRRERGGKKRQGAEPRKEAKRQGERKPRRKQEPRARREEQAPQEQPQAQPGQEQPALEQQPEQRQPQDDGRQQGRSGRQPRRDRQQQPQQQRHQQQQQRGKGRPQGPRVPEPSEGLAYWVGVAILAAKREGAELVMSADRRVGQNFAGTWAGLTRDLFGVRPVLKMLDDGRAQEARLPIAGFEEFLDRLELKEGKALGEPGVPRWAWSNPAWKAACLKGLVDARAYFQRKPALVLEGIPARLAQAFQKMLSAFQLTAQVSETGTVTLEGVETLDRYFEKVGASNMKLRDQYRAFRNPRGGRPAVDADGAPAAVTAAGTATEAPAHETVEATEEEHGRVVAEEVEAADEEAEIAAHHVEEAEERQPEAHDPDAALDAAAAAKAFNSPQPSRFAPPPPQPKEPPKRHGPRRTMFRGRPRR